MSTSRADAEHIRQHCKLLRPSCTIIVNNKLYEKLHRRSGPEWRVWSSTDDYDYVTDRSLIVYLEDHMAAGPTVVGPGSSSKLHPKAEALLKQVQEWEERELDYVATLAEYITICSQVQQALAKRIEAAAASIRG